MTQLPFHVATSTVYPNLHTAGRSLGVLGLDEDSAFSVGIVMAYREELPPLVAGQTASLDDLPTQNGDGSWSFKWTVSELPPDQIKARLSTEWQRRVDTGGVFNVTGVADPIPVPGKQPYREIIQAKISAAQVFLAQGVTDPVMLFRDGDNVNRRLTPAQMIELCLQSMRFYEELSTVYWAMKDGTGDFTSGIPVDFTEDKYWP